MDPRAPPRVWQKIDRAILHATEVSVFAVGVSFTAMVVVEVASRFVLDTSISQTNAVARFLLVWFFMLGAGLALRQGAHVALTLLTERVPQRHARAISNVAQVLSLIVLAMLLWSGYLAFRASLPQVEGSLGVSLAWVMAAFPVGLCLLIYHQIVMLVVGARAATPSW
jgi:TRAP-type C4-dicarboxylate transport system permease small subunit